MCVFLEVCFLLNYLSKPQMFRNLLERDVEDRMDYHVKIEDVLRRVREEINILYTVLIKK